MRKQLTDGRGGKTRPPEIGVGKLLRRGHMAFSREFRNRLKAHGISFSEFIHLERLWAEDGLNQAELSKRVGIESASSTAVLDALEKRSFIRRERDPRDRRNIKVFLRPLGATLQNKLLACAKATNLLARKGMSRSDVLTFFSLMQTIVDNLEQVESNRAAASYKRPMKPASPDR